MNVTSESLAELFEQYKEEVKETIETLDTKLVAIEQDPANSEVIFSLFRHLHSLKGSSKMFNVENIAHIAHKLEDLMQLIDKDNSILKRFPKIVDLLFQGNDIFRDIIDRLENDITFLNLTAEHLQFIEQINHQFDQLSRKENLLVEKAKTVLDEIEAILPSIEDIDLTALNRAVGALSGQIDLWAAGGSGGAIRYTYGGKDFSELMHNYEAGLEKFKKGSFTQEDSEGFFKNAGVFIQALFEVAEEGIMEVLQELNDGLDMFEERALDIDPIVIEFFSTLLEDLKKNLKAEAAGNAGMDLTESAPAAAAADSRVAHAGSQPQVKTIRVDEKKIDLFLESVGKLITQSEILNHLQYSFKQAGINPGLVREFAALNRSISSDIISLQKSIMEVRQVEIGNILKKFPRLVRDISHSMNKDVELLISGEHVPIDKSLLEDVEKALIHIVRNSIDHGLETAEVRQAAGKDPRGLISVNVEQEEASIIIEVSDDGRGVDLAQIRRKALEKGIISQDELKEMSDEEVQSLLFRSGFTTKTEATDISGRGVGLDVVRSNIRKWNGEIKLENRPGLGLTIRLFIPITNTLLTKEAIMIVLGDSTFCLPLENVVEIITVPDDKLVTHKDHRVFEHRGNVIAVINIKEQMKLPAGEEKRDGVRTFVILRGKKESRKAICADRIVGQQKIVIKDFELEAFRRLPYCQGLTLLGDGRVVLVLDAERIVD